MSVLRGLAWPSAFAYNFSYDSLAIHCYYRDFYNDTDWMNTIYSELSAGRTEPSWYLYPKREEIRKITIR